MNTTKIIPALEVSEYRDSFELWPVQGPTPQRLAIIPFDGNKERARETAEQLARLYSFTHLVRDFTTGDSAGHMRYLHEQASIALGECCASLYGLTRQPHCCTHSYLLPCPRCEVA